ncbi:MAG: S-methyl-5-thioribose-1-phosphate isomerase [Desulfovibrionales bacterium]
MGDEHIRFNTASGELVLLDQRHLPLLTEWFVCRTVEEVVTALQVMVVRGAPAIGVTAAYGCCIAARQVAGQGDWRPALEALLDTLAAARPTAVNLGWAVDRMRRAWSELPGVDLPGLTAAWDRLAGEMHREDVEANKRLGAFGAALLGKGDRVMTHCNAGALATAGYGTALGVVRAAREQGKEVSVIANETRPFLQGARLTAFELLRDHIPVTVACDNACGLLMRKGLVDAVVVGADRIAANGDTANKIGTYGVALLARAHDIPFYVAAPLSTIDRQVARGEDIPIEERPDEEVTRVGTCTVVPQGVPVFNYAFDITPHSLITALVTDQGVLRPPFEVSIRSAFSAAGAGAE